MSAGMCSAPGCQKPRRSRDYCAMHYARIVRYGDLERQREKPRDPKKHLLERVTVTASGCWQWNGQLESNGYARTALYGHGRQLAHRLSYTAFVGPIPDGLHIDHLCRNRACCNPQHLEPVTPQENYLRGVAPSAVSARTGRCPLGHELETRHWATRSGRYCRTCQNESRRQRRAAQRSAA